MALSFFAIKDFCFTGNAKPNPLSINKNLYMWRLENVVSFEKDAEMSSNSN